MEAKYFILLISLLAAPSVISAQNINCVFVVAGTHYDCVLSSLFIADNETIVYNIIGQHQPTRTDADVTRVIISNSLVPFIIPQFFLQFVNLQQYLYTDSAFETRVQNNAFQNATNLQEITIARTTNLTIFPNSFTGVTSLQRLNLQSNRLAGIPNGMLTGLVNLTTIDFSNNLIPSIAEAFLRGQIHLTSMNLNNNLLRRIPNTLLGTNTNLNSFHAQTNQIYQIGRLFLNNLSALTTLSLSGNECVNLNWGNIGGIGGPSKEIINQALQTCFNNYQGGGEFVKYGFQLRGNVRLYNEDGILVGQL